MEEKYTISKWTLIFSDTGTKKKKNPNKYNFDRSSNICRVIGCNEKVRVTRTSGLCNSHVEHSSDLILRVNNPQGYENAIPAHKNIVDQMIEWARIRNYNLSPFFEHVSFMVLGNVPDISTLTGVVKHDSSIEIPTMREVIEFSLGIVHDFFPEGVNSSYQLLKTSKGDFPIIILAYMYVGLIICEEANRGNRWHSRVIRKDERETTELGGAMSIAYYAARSFPWGVDLGKSSDLLTR